MSNGPVEAWKAISCSLALHVTALLTVYSVLPTIEPVQFGGENEVLEIESAFVSDSEGDVLYEPPIAIEPMDWDESAARDYLPAPQADSSAALQKTTTDSVVEPNHEVADETATPEHLPPQPEIVFRKPNHTPQPITRRPSRPRSLPMPSSATTTIAGLDETVPPVLTADAPLDYPAEAVRRRLEGEVMLELRVMVDGTINDVKVLRSSGHPILDRAALESVKKWKGRPATRGGKPVESTERLPIRFRL